MRMNASTIVRVLFGLLVRAQCKANDDGRYKHDDRDENGDERQQNDGAVRVERFLQRQALVAVRTPAERVARPHPEQIRMHGQPIRDDPVGVGTVKHLVPAARLRHHRHQRR
uniref:Putative secreted peptide n=1 Tax=Anopheles braziliensis TaxID=58242 RepID=A0A2M3ZUF8_9DIPT